ncbi:hypothetical protein AQ611_08035 [Burkholderia singularis]|nr:hypothetical protein AQ611_08035 [Burkholderia sp. Bp7605]
MPRRNTECTALLSIYGLPDRSRRAFVDAITAAVAREKRQRLRSVSCVHEKSAHPSRMRALRRTGFAAGPGCCSTR